MNEVRTYMSFTYPVDPVKIQTIPDMDMSYALSSTLVKWGPDKELSAGLANKWEVVDAKTYRLTLRPDARWSDGKSVTCADVVGSFNRAIKDHPEDLRSLAQMLDKMTCHSARELDFELKIPAHGSGLIEKLTEPNYCVLKLNAHGVPDLSVSTGAFYLAAESKSELVLMRNPQWFGFDSGSPERVIVRRPPETIDPETILLKDSWPNLIEMSSLMSQDLFQQYKHEAFEIWQRPLDKVFLFQLGKRITGPDGKALLRFLRKNASSSDFVAGLSGFRAAEQLFPRGYQLYDPKSPSGNKDAVTLPSIFRSRPLDIAISPTRVSSALRENIRRNILHLTGVEPNFILVALEDLRQFKVKGDFDIYAGTVGLADPDPEGAMSFYLEGAAPPISSSGNDFLTRLDRARKEGDREKRLTIMRSILTDSVCEGYLMPVFHLSTVGIGRPELDFSNIPQSEESVTLSKIRFRVTK